MADSLAHSGPSGRPLVSAEYWREMLNKHIHPPPLNDASVRAAARKKFPQTEQFQCLMSDTNMEHHMGLDIDSAPAPRPLTHVVCTIGPASRGVDTLVRLAHAGMSVCRLNFSHGTYDYHRDTVNNIRQAQQQLAEGAVLGLALDTKGPEIRTGLLNGGAAAPDIQLDTGKTIRLTVNDAYKEKCSTSYVWCDYKKIVDTVPVGGMIFVDDGLISLKVKSKEKDCLVCDIVNGGKLGGKKGCNLPGQKLDLPAVSGKDREDLLFGVDQGVDMVFASFIQNGENIREIRRVLGQKGERIKVIAKIESFSGLWNFPDVLQEADGVMVARGDMGIEIPPEKVFVAQKMMISLCNRVGKPVICATQMLDSMTYKPRATRAESNDVANAVLDGADCVMLSGETAKGEYPVEAVAHMAACCREAEAVYYSKRHLIEMRRFTPLFTDASHALAQSAVDMVHMSMARGILCLTDSGRTAHLLAAYKPRCPVLVVTRDAMVARQAMLYRALIPCVFAPPASAAWQDQLNQRVARGLQAGVAWGAWAAGDLVVLVTSLQPGSARGCCVQMFNVPR